MCNVDVRTLLTFAAEKIFPVIFKDEFAKTVPYAPFLVFGPQQRSKSLHSLALADTAFTKTSMRHSLLTPFLI